MSRFQSDFSAPLAGLAEYFGEEVWFIRNDVKLPVRFAVIAEESEEAAESPDGRRTRKIRWIQVVTDPKNRAYCGITTWPVDSVVVIGKRHYQVATSLIDTAGATQVKLRHVTIAARSQPGIRGRDLPSVS